MADCCAELRAELAALRAEIAKLKPVDEEAIVAKSVRRSEASIVPQIGPVANTIVLTNIGPLQSKVETAQSTANAAQKTATTAQSSANAAREIASDASGIAKSARATATNALNKAVDALNKWLGVVNLIGELLSGIALIQVLGGRVDSVENGLDRLGADVSRVLSLLGLFVKRSEIGRLRGPQGERGLQGLRGERGPIGLRGERGLQGMRGLQGLKGLQGIRGPQGLRGVQGIRGPQGLPGRQGERGLQGSRGLQGLSGKQGERGLQGSRGPQGLTGSQGLPGRQGLPGPAGAPGIQGSIGPRGPMGPRGIPGPTGPQGVPGLQGVAGPTGPAGPPGISGAEEEPKEMKFVDISVPIFQSCDGQNPRFTQQTISVIEGTERQEILKFQRIAAIESSSCYLSKTVGVDDYPVQVPTTLTDSNSGDIKIQNLTRFLSYAVKQFDALCGKYPIEIEIEDADLTQQGNQTQRLKLPNIAETLAEIVGLLMILRTESDATLSATLRGMIEAGSTKQTATLAYEYAKANAEYLGYKGKQVERELAMAFTPGEEELDKVLKEATIRYRGWENDDKEDLSDHLAPLLELAAMWKAANFRHIPPNAPGALLELLKRGAGELANNMDNSNPDSNKHNSWDSFLEEAEQGFISQPGITDTTHPYNKDFKRRPKIREIGSDTSDTSNTGK